MADNGWGIKMTKESIDGIVVNLEIEDTNVLFLLLAADGLVNRMGDGTVDSASRTLFVGKSAEPLFDRLRERIHPDWFEHAGAYDVPGKVGPVCTLTILFKDKERHEAAFRFRYGLQSQGPPRDICEFVSDAVRITDAWYEEQQNLRR